MNNREKIAALSRELGLDAILLTEDANRRYATGSNAEGMVLITASGEGFAFTDSRYIEELEQRAAPLGYRVALPPEMRYSLALETLTQEKGLRHIGMEEDRISLARYRSLSQALSASLEPAGEGLMHLRECKTAEEVESITAAQRIAEQALEELIAEIRPGRTERELAAFLNYRMASLGSEGTAFTTILLSGERTSLPHGEPSDRPVGEHEFILIDFGARVNGYCSDMTRTLALGRPDEEMERVYHLVLEAQLAGIAAMEVGKTGAEVHEAAHQVLRAGGCGDYFGHALGHSLGLEIHELPSCSPRSRALLKPGNILTVEPGVYLPGRFGVRIEDMIWLSPEGKVNLTRSDKKLRIL